MAITAEKKKKKKFKTVDQFLQEELGISLKEFLDKEVRRKLKTKLRVVLKVTPEHHYEVEVNKILKEDVDIRILGFGRFGMSPIGYTNTVLLEIFDTPINLQPLECQIEHLVNALK